MVCSLDELKETSIQIDADPSLFINKEFMMNMFKQEILHLPGIFILKIRHQVSKDNSIEGDVGLFNKVLPLSMLISEVFNTL